MQVIDWLAVVVVLLLHWSHLLCRAVAVVSPLTELTAEACQSELLIVLRALKASLPPHSHSVHICLHCRSPMHCLDCILATMPQ